MEPYLVPTVEKNSAIPIDCLRVLDKFDDVQLEKMKRGIVFVLAAWSGPAVMGLRKYTQVLAEMDTSTLDLVVLDIDCLTPESRRMLFGTNGFHPRGNGEAIWVRNGVVAAREFTSSASEQVIRRHTRELMDEATG